MTGNVAKSHDISEEVRSPRNSMVIGVFGRSRSVMTGGQGRRRSGDLRFFSPFQRYSASPGVAPLERRIHWYAGVLHLSAPFIVLRSIGSLRARSRPERALDPVTLRPNARRAFETSGLGQPPNVARPRWHG